MLLNIKSKLLAVLYIIMKKILIYGYITEKTKQTLV